MDRRRSSTTNLPMRTVALVVVTWLAVTACGGTNAASDDEAGGRTAAAPVTTSTAQRSAGTDTGAEDEPASPQDGDDSSPEAQSRGGGGGDGSGDRGSASGSVSGPAGSASGDGRAPGSTAGPAPNAPLPRPGPGNTPAPGPRPAPGSTPGTPLGPAPRPSSSSSSAPPEGSTVVVAGPTLDDSYSEAFGSLPTPYRPICVFYDPDPAASEVTVRSVVVEHPFVQVLDVADCRYEGGPAWQGPVCRAGQPLGIEPQYNGQDTRGCWFGVALAPDAALEANHQGRGASMTFSVVCVAVDDLACRDLAVEPSPLAPVTVPVAVSTQLRYCGATDYKNARGEPSAPSDSSADNGCI